MQFPRRQFLQVTAVAAAIIATLGSAVAQSYPSPKEGDWTARDFKFHTGEVLPELRLHYTTVGEPSGQPVVILRRSSKP